MGKGVSRVSHWKLFAGVGIVAVATVLSASGEELTERERELLIVIESLKERVTALEEKNTATVPAVASDDVLTERVEALETAVVEKKKGEANDFRAYWKDGVNLDTVDESFTLKIGAQIHSDWFWFD